MDAVLVWAGLRLEYSATMADIFVSYTRMDQEIVRNIVALLEAEGRSVWWDNRISGGERWDAVIEREITTARCVVVVWTPRSVDREWVLMEANHGRNRGVLVPILIDCSAPPFAFSLIQARNLTGWTGRGRSAAIIALLSDVKNILDGGAPPPLALELTEEEARRASIAQEEHRRVFEATAASDRAKILELYRRERRLPVEPGSGQWFKDFKDGPEMVVVPSGVFVRTFRSQSVDVTIQAPFAVSRFEVTFDEWDAAGAAGGVKHKPIGDRRGCYPVNNVSWHDAKEYVAWLSAKTGQRYRLLSDAEWEYCCRAGTTTKYAFGEYITKQQALFGSTAISGPNKVGSFLPNAWGLYDMHGNLREWCEDAYHAPDVKTTEMPCDGSVWEGGDPERRMMRGGGFGDNADLLRPDVRIPTDASERHAFFGLRVARTLATSPSPVRGSSFWPWHRN